MAFTPQGIASILRNPAYVGDFTWNKSSTGKFSRLVGGVALLEADVKRGKNDESEWIIVRDSHLPIVDRDAASRHPESSAPLRARSGRSPPHGRVESSPHRELRRRCGGSSS